MRRWNRKAFVLLLTLVVATACSSGDTSSEDTSPAATSLPEAAEPDSIRLGFAFPPDFSMPGYYVSQDVGYFTDDGLEVELVIVDGTSQVIQQLIAGNIDVGVGGPPPAVLLAGTEGSDVAAYYQIDQRNIFDIVVPADSDVETLEDLEGQVLGVTNFSGGEIPVVNAALEGAGFYDGANYVGLEVVAVGDGGPQVAAAFEADRIAAFSGGDADTLNLQQAGLELRSILPEEYAVIPGNLIMATREVLDTRADVMARFGRAFAKGTVFAIASPTAALELGCEFAPESCTDQEFAELAMEYYVDLETPPEGSPMGAINMTGWEAVLEILQNQGEVGDDFELDPYVDDSLLDEINDFDRAAVEADATG
jgi:NitT/TauT family transport system substrate-binding protein